MPGVSCRRRCRCRRCQRLGQHYLQLREPSRWPRERRERPTGQAATIVEAAAKRGPSQGEADLHSIWQSLRGASQGRPQQALRVKRGDEQ
eukprot:11259023-Alexandrium_andersonii.AAC.1